jgi:UDP-N-acetylmuramate dehydrogenase
MTLPHDIRTWLTEHLGPRVKFDEPMSRHTSLRVGGPAEAFVTPAHKHEVVALVRLAREYSLPCLVIGDGTNLLVRDRGIQGLVVILTQALKSIDSIEQIQRGVLVRAMAGARMASLCTYAIRSGLAGLAFALGLPGTVGGAITMNAGTALGTTGAILDSIDVLLSSGEERHLARRQLSFGYRELHWDPALADPVLGFPLIMAGCFNLQTDERQALEAQAAEIMHARRRWLPTRLPSAGCFFKNPAAGPSAGELIDRAGMKGQRIGDAMVSSGHANFIVNTGKASAADILALAEEARERVAAKFDITLEPEVRIVGI